MQFALQRATNGVVHRVFRNSFSMLFRFIRLNASVCSCVLLYIFFFNFMCFFSHLIMFLNVLSLSVSLAQNCTVTVYSDKRYICIIPFCCCCPSWSRCWTLVEVFLFCFVLFWSCIFAISINISIPVYLIRTHGRCCCFNIPIFAYLHLCRWYCSLELNVYIARCSRAHSISKGWCVRFVVVAFFFCYSRAILFFTRIFFLLQFLLLFWTCVFVLFQLFMFHFQLPFFYVCIYVCAPSSHPFMNMYHERSMQMQKRISARIKNWTKKITPYKNI